MASNSTTRLLPGKQPLAREIVVRHQRERIITAFAAETSERGYRTVTVAHLVKRAGIARKTFYENFSSKEDCFLEAQKFAISSALKRVIEAAGQSEKWPEQVAAGLAAFLDYIVEEPALARTCMVDALAAGSISAERYEEALRPFIALLKLGRSVSSLGKKLPETMEEAIIGGIFWIIHRRLIGCSVESVPELLPEIVEFALTPYLGAEAAREVSAAQQTG
ncbi:MAG: TetR/AcrR family transcriptional regulator [Solirubrobacterales bacterium]